MSLKNLGFNNPSTYNDDDSIYNLNNEKGFLTLSKKEFNNEVMNKLMKLDLFNDILRKPCRPESKIK